VSDRAERALLRKQRVAAYLFTGLYVAQAFVALQHMRGADVRTLVHAGRVLAVVGFFVFPVLAYAALSPHVSEKRRGEWPTPKVLVDEGIYRLVRHPMSLGYMICSAGLMMIAQHWASYVIGGGVIAYVYLSILLEERVNLTKLGDAYRDYMQRVPRVNVLRGIARFLRSRSRRSTG